MKTINLMNLNLNLTTTKFTRFGACFLISAALAACGSGGGSEAPESAIVQTVAAAQTLEGAAGTTTQLQFVVTLDRPAVKGLDVYFSTASTVKPGINSMGSAQGGASCAAGIDFVSATASKVSIAKGVNTANLTVTVCGDATFEPNETLKIIWTAAGSSGGNAIGTIVNDDAGGLNGSGAAIVMGGITAFGRDTNSLTNDPSDGALGFSFEHRQADGVVSATDSNWNCTYDKVSGLTWQRLDTSAAATNSSYSALPAYVSSINTSHPCGYTDWRLPTANELLSLMDASITSASGAASNADRKGTTDAMTGSFWTSESRPFPNSTQAWYVPASQGGVAEYQDKANSSGVRLVRGGHVNSVDCNNTDARFSDMADSTVADANTGLMWKQCPEGLSDASGAGVRNCGIGAALSFNDVPTVLSRLAVINSPSSPEGLGYSDWRIPAKNELASLVNRACASPAIAASVFPATGTFSYVSATYDANNSNQFWYAEFGDGTVAVTPINSPGGIRLRLVRSGQ